MKKIKEIMSREVDVISPESTVQEGAHLMKALDSSAIPVCDGEKLVGMVTDRDIAIRVAADGHGSQPSTPLAVKEVMTQPIQFCFEDQEDEEVQHLMESQQVRRLAVLNRDKRLVGVISMDDIAPRSDTLSAA